MSQQAIVISVGDNVTPRFAGALATALGVIVSSTDCLSGEIKIIP